MHATAPNPSRMEEARFPSRVPVHPLSALMLLVVDNLWMLADWAVVDWVITIPLAFATVFLPTLVIQRFIKKDRGARAFGIACLLGALAAVPTSLTGTPAGLAFLAWTGLDRILGKTAARKPPTG